MDAPEALREFLSYVVANLIDHPQQATITIGTNINGAVAYRVQLAPEDVRHVIVTEKDAVKLSPQRVKQQRPHTTVWVAALEFTPEASFMTALDQALAKLPTTH